MSNKVYCSECEFYWCIDYPPPILDHKCNKSFLYIDNPINIEVEDNCLILNKNNDCKFFKPKIMKIKKRTFLQTIAKFLRMKVVSL